jgi:hypothetical protein
MLPWHVTALVAPLLLASCTTTIQKVRVTSKPSGSRILIDGADSGQTTPADVVLSLSEEYYKITVEKGGYNPVSRVVHLETDVDVIHPKEAAGKILCAPCCLGLPLLDLLEPVEVTKMFMPSRIDAELDVEGQGLKLTKVFPDSVEFYLDGRLTRPLEGRYLTMSPGDHELVAHAEGFRDLDVVVRIASGIYQDLAVELQVEGQGLLLDVSPEGARILVNNQFQGTSTKETKQLRLESGPQQLRVEKDGYVVWQDVIQIVPERYDELDLVLSLEGQGILLHKPNKLRRGQDNIQILVDGALTSTAFGKPIRLEPGTHAIEVQIPGYRSWQRKVLVQEGQYLDLEPTLKR